MKICCMNNNFTLETECRQVRNAKTLKKIIFSYIGTYFFREKCTIMHFHFSMTKTIKGINKELKYTLFGQR